MPAKGDRVKLREKTLADARHDYAWQTDEELTRLDAAPLLGVSFPVYLLDYLNNALSNPPQAYRFAVEAGKGDHIGNCSCYNIYESSGEGEVGIMIGNRDYWDKGFGADAMCALVDYIFRETGLARLHLRTLLWNKRAQKCFLKAGFTPCGEILRGGHQFVLMELYRWHWEEELILKKTFKKGWRLRRAKPETKA